MTKRFSRVRAVLLVCLLLLFSAPFALAKSEDATPRPAADAAAQKSDTSATRQTATEEKIIARHANASAQETAPDNDAQDNDEPSSKSERWRREQEARKRAFVVRYTGELMRADKTPISGVLPMTFAIYEHEKDDKPVWKERRFVAVDLGMYTIDLGEQSELPRTLENQTRWLSIDIDSFGEILRDKLVLTPWVDKKQPTPTHVQNLSFAEIADRALTADHAHLAANAERLGGKTLQEIDKYGDLYRDFVQLRAKLNAIQASGGTRVAERTTITEEAGQRGGRYYRIMCPEGQVVVGITGSADDTIHELKLICAPLENRR